MVWVDNYPCPHGPGFVTQLPSVKGNVDPSGTFIILSSISSLPCSCWSLVRDFDEPSLLQYCGALADIPMLPSSYSNSSSIIWILTPVSFSISLACVRASLIGEMEGRGMSCEWSFSVMLFRSILIGCLIDFA